LTISGGYQIAQQHQLLELFQLPPKLSISDTIGTGLWGWSFWPSAAPDLPPYPFNYALTRDPSTGNAAPSARIAGGITSDYDPCSMAAPCVTGNFGMQKTFTVDATKDVQLNFDYRAASGYSASSVTNASIKVTDATTGALYFSQSLASGGTYDTGWLHKSIT